MGFLITSGVASMDLITGLPIHPLINHAVAVLIPLSAIGAILVIFVKRFRTTYSPLVLIAVLSGAVSAFVAGQSGEAVVTAELAGAGSRRGRGV